MTSSRTTKRLFLEVFGYIKATKKQAFGGAGSGFSGIFPFKISAPVLLKSCREASNQKTLFLSRKL